MTRACLAMLAGMYSQQLGEIAVPSDLVPGALVAVGFVIILRPFFWPAWLLFGAVLFANSVFSVVDTRLDPALAGESLLVTIRVAGFPTQKAASVSFFAVPVDAPRLPPRLRLSWHAPPVSIRPDDVWRLELRLRRPRSASNPGAADFEAWLTRERVGALGYVVNSRRNHLLLSRHDDAVMRLRERFVTRVSALFGDQGRGAVLAALVVGARHLLTAEQWDRYARTGTSHLMAISGLHVGLAATGGYLLMRVLCLFTLWRGNQHLLAAGAGIIVAVLYALVSGLGVPSQRAGFMLALAGLILLARRRPDKPALLCAAAMLVAVSDPLVTLSAGFKLSFLAVAVLLWGARQWTNTGAGVAVPGGRLCLRARQLADVQLLLLFGLLPVIVLHFSRIAFAAPPSNFLAVPVFSAVTVPFALLGFVLDGPVSAIGDACLHVAGASIAIIEWLLERAAAADWLAPSLPAVSGIAWLYLGLPALLVIAPPGLPGRRLGLLGLLALLLHTPARPHAGCVSVQVLDVGQGLAAVIETRERVVVYDTGPAYRSGRSSAETVILPFLASRDITRIDRLIVSHGDLDHAGGAAAMLNALEIGELLLGEALPAVSANSRPCRAGIRWHYDGVDFRILHPPDTGRFADNDASCVLLIEAGGQRMLFPGDIERRGEAALLRHHGLRPMRAIVVPHHGSATSSGPALVAATAPDIAIVATGFGNRWGFPADGVVRRWQAAGARILTTASSGAVGLQFCSAGPALEVSQHRITRRRIWNE